MGRNNNNGYGYNGYNPNVSEAVKRVKLPDLIKCGRCKKQKNHNCYSKNRMTDLQSHIYKNGGFDAKNVGFISCTMCSGAAAQQLELFCVGCDRTLPKAAFAKTQCRTPDNAKCMKCVQRHLEYEPGGVSSDDDSGHDGSGGSDDEPGGTSTMVGGMSQMSINGNSSGGVNINSTSGANGGGYGSATTSQTPRTSNRNTVTETGSLNTNQTMHSDWTNTTTTKTSSTLPAGSDRDAHGTPPHMRAKGTAAVGTGTKSIAESSGSGKFAKVKASDADRRRWAQPKKIAAPAAAPAPVPGIQDDDDIGVESSDSDDE